MTCVDWRPSHAWTENDTDFTGQITVLGLDPAVPLATAGWDTPTDQAADHALHRTGWHRTGQWATDPDGRRTAPVTRDPHQSKS